MKRQNLQNERYGRLLVKSFADVLNGRARWLCICDCGTEKVIRGHDLKMKRILSCGCLKREKCDEMHKNNITHGEGGKNKKSPEYEAWAQMRSRCNNPNHAHWDRYGGSGIKVCQRWQSSFINFLADMGRRPSDAHSIDRYPDPYGDYEPANCRWATALQQRHNWRSKEKERIHE